MHAACCLSGHAMVSRRWQAYLMQAVTQGCAACGCCRQHTPTPTPTPTILAVVCQLVRLLPELLPVNLVYRALGGGLDGLDEGLHLYQQQRHQQQQSEVRPTCRAAEGPGCMGGHSSPSSVWVASTVTATAWAGQEGAAGDPQQWSREASSATVDTHIGLQPSSSLRLGRAGPEFGCQFSLCAPLL